MGGDKLRTKSSVKAINALDFKFGLIHSANWETPLNTH